MTPIFVRKNKLGNSNGKTRLIGIWIWKDAPLFAAVLAHERYHFSLFWKIFLAGLIPTCAAGYFVHPFVGIIVALFGAGAPLIPVVKRYSEAHGHAVECAVAARFYGADLPAYQYNEAVAIADLFDDQEEAEDALVDLEDWANHWVKRHESTIRKDMARA